jgi:hypothetical protein
MPPPPPIAAVPPPVPPEDRAVVRAVALAYRRVMRARPGGHPPTYQALALDAAEAVFLSYHPEAAADRGAMSHRVNTIIANAVAADPQWFWHGPDV